MSVAALIGVSPGGGAMRTWLTPPSGLYPVGLETERNPTRSPRPDVPFSRHLRLLWLLFGSRASICRGRSAGGRASGPAGRPLVYGGGRVGLMGIVADAVLEAGGRVDRRDPRGSGDKEIAHDGLTELHVVSGMHERKALMADMSSAFLTLPGGIGTFEEFFEILSWAALGIHQKPIGVLNIDGYFDPLLALLDHGIAQEFIRPELPRLLLVSDGPENLIADLLAYAPPSFGPRGSSSRRRDRPDRSHLHVARPGTDN